MNELKQKLDRFISTYGITAWLVVILGAGLVLQFVLYIVAGLIGEPALFPKMMSFLVMPDNFGDIIYRPWTIVTWPFFYVSPHFQMDTAGAVGMLGAEAKMIPVIGFSFLRPLFGGLILWTFGRIMNLHLGEQRAKQLILLAIPIIGILTLLLRMLIGTGNTFFLSGIGPIMVLAAITAASLTPNYPIQLFLFGKVKIVWIALVLFLLEIVSVLGAGISPGMVATILAGLIGGGHIYALQAGTDIPDLIWNYYKAKEPSANTTKSKKSKRKTSAKRKMEVVKDDNGSIPQAEIDRILDKILEHGQNSLTKEERDTLFRAKDEDESTRK